MALLAALVITFSPRPCAGVTDNYLCMPLPGSWSHSVGFGVANGRCAAWMYAGNYRFRRAPHDEGVPDVPRGRILITIGDFPRIHNRWHWRRVKRLRLSQGKPEWRVIFHDRSLFLSVHFGSKPDARMRRIANTRLRSVRRELGPDRCVPH